MNESKAKFITNQKGLDGRYCGRRQKARSQKVCLQVDRYSDAMLTSDKTSVSKCCRQEGGSIRAIRGRGVSSALHRGLGSHVETGADVAVFLAVLLWFSYRFLMHICSNTLQHFTLSKYTFWLIKASDTALAVF